MARYVVLLRGINVGGQNSVSMSTLKDVLGQLGYSGVATFINSGNVVLDTTKSASAIEAEIERELPARFRLDSALIKVLALSKTKFKAMIDSRPDGFGDEPDLYNYDAIFLMNGVKAKDAFTAFTPREGVDAVCAGDGVIYHRRLTAQRTKSRLNRVMATDFYKSMTVRNWATTTKLAEMLDA